MACEILGLRSLKIVQNCSPIIGRTQRRRKDKGRTAEKRLVPNRNIPEKVKKEHSRKNVWNN
jgi:hypothetical protein